MWFLIILIAVACAENVTEAPKINEEALLSWIRSADETLAGIFLATPLRPEFNVSYLARRNLLFVTKRQLARLRAQVATAMIETMQGDTQVCPAPQVSDAVVSTLQNELSALGFNVRLVDAPVWCPYRQGVSVQVPPPVLNVEQDSESKSSEL